MEEMGRRGVGAVEGYRNAETLEKYLTMKGVGREDAPLFYAVYSVLYEGASPEEIAKKLG